MNSINTAEDVLTINVESTEKNMTRINLFDPGMNSKTLDFETEEAALASFVPGAYKVYTDALISTSGKVTHMAKRQVGQDLWVVTVRNTFKVSKGISFSIQAKP